MSTFLPTLRTRVLLLPIFLIINTAVGHAFDLRPEIDPIARPLVDEGVAVGLVVGIYKDGETQVISYGETEKGSGTAPNGDTIYEIGSASKVFTGVLLADLIQRGRVKLDDPMQKYLPETAKSKLKNPTHITFKHLATHTSGLPRLPDNLQPTDMANPYADYTFRQMFAFLSEHEPRRSPGEYEYSNYGMGLLGVLLASRERMPYEQLMVTHIAKPCGMDDTTVKLSNEQRRRLAPPYDAALQAAKNWDFPTLAGCGGIRSTTNDMLKFIAANLADDNKPLTKALKLSHRKHHAMPNGQAIGLAWHIHLDGFTRWHNGMTGGYASWVAIVPRGNVGVVVLSNTAAEQITEIGTKITRIAFDGNTGPVKALPNAQVPPEVLKSYVGVYAITPQFALNVTLEADELIVQATGQGKIRLVPESTTKFSCRGVDAQITFVRDDDGRADQLILHQGGANQVAVRQK